MNRGAQTALLAGTTEAHVVPRSALTIAGVPTAGAVSLQFLIARPRSLLDRVGQIFGHASNLSDGLVPEWLVWLLALLIVLCVPLATVAALYLALSEDLRPRAR